MGIFSRFADIVSSNLNSILDRAEDPEKMVRLMIVEMEDTLVELRHQCAGVIADQKKVERRLAESRSLADEWEGKARLALKKDREDLARQAIAEKRRHSERAGAYAEERDRLKEAVASFQSDLAQLEAKLEDARDKQRSIVARKAAASAKRQAQGAIRRADTSEAFMKFEAYENHIDRMEADADLIARPRPKDELRDEFSRLEHEDEIESELARLKSDLGK